MGSLEGDGLLENVEVVEAGDNDAQQAAATKVQAISRGRKARASARRAPPAAEAASSGADAGDDDAAQAAAASRMQARARGRNARAQTGEMAAAKKRRQQEDAEQAAAATRVQAITRGRKARASKREPSQQQQQQQQQNDDYDEEDDYDQQQQQQQGLPRSRPGPSMAARAARAAAEGAAAQRSGIARPAGAAPSQSSPARSYTGGASCSGGAYGASSVDSAYGAYGAYGGGATGPDSSMPPGGFCSEAEYRERMGKIARLKREAEDRRKQEHEARLRREDIYQMQLREEEEAMKHRAAMREEEALRAREEQRKRFAQERQYREQKREELKQKELREVSMRVKPLYKRREEEAAERVRKEEAAREAELLKNRDKFKPLDFLQPEIDLPDSAFAQLPPGREPSRIRKAEPTVSLPPIKQYYRGAARDKVVAELKAQRAGKQEAVKVAAERKSKAMKYSKLVAELVEVQPQLPVPAADSTRSRPPVDPASRPGARQGKAGATPAAKGGATPASSKGGSTRGSPTGGHVKEPRRLFGGGGGGGGGGGPAGAVSKEFEDRSAALNKELKRKESQLQGRIAKQGNGSEAEIEALVGMRHDLSAVYIGAIRSKVELLEEINSVTASPANTA